MTNKFTDAFFALCREGNDSKQIAAAAAVDKFQIIFKCAENVWTITTLVTMNENIREKEA